MSLPTVKLGSLSVSKIAIGGNPFSGFSHQNPKMDLEMRRYYTYDRIKATLRHAEDLGINTIVARADNHISRLLMEYWEQGGTIQWVAQTLSEMVSLKGSIDAGVNGGAKAVYVHGGKTDWSMAAGNMDEVVEGMKHIRQAGVVTGMAAHRTQVLDWAEAEKVDVDFYLCAHYDPTPRDFDPVHNPDAPESWLPEDRDKMLRTIAGLSKPVIHYKVLAGGNADVKESLGVVARHLRPQDVVVIGFFTKYKPDMMEEDIRMVLGG